MSRVDFLICGAQKCGTTALDFYLRQHPLLCFPSKKELHYFDDDAAFAGDIPDYGAYHAWFTPEARHRLLGETTPIYLYKPEVMPRIRAYNPDMKLIAVLRHPVDRAYSHWNMLRARGESVVGFREALEHELAIMAAPENSDASGYTCIRRGLYAQQLTRLWQHFPREQTLILRHERLLAQPEAVLTRVCDFLGMPRLQGIAPRRVHAYPYPEPMAERDRRLLLGFFREDTEALLQLLGWDCSAWMA
jgi:hypothetical protein